MTFKTGFNFDYFYSFLPFSLLEQFFGAGKGKKFSKNFILVSLFRFGFLPIKQDCGAGAESFSGHSLELELALSFSSEPAPKVSSAKYCIF